MRPQSQKEISLSRCAYRCMQSAIVAISLMVTTAQAAPDIHVPISDQHDMPKAVVRTIAARLSNDALMVVVYGNDAALTYDMKRAVRDAHLAGLPARGLVIGSGAEPRAVDVYADGLLVAEQKQPGPHVYEQTMKSLTYGADLLKRELAHH